MKSFCHTPRLTGSVTKINLAYSNDCYTRFAFPHNVQSRAQQSNRGRAHLLFRLFVHPSQECIFRGPINQRHECSTVPFTDNGVGLPVADPHLFLHDGRALRNVHSARNMAPTGMAFAFLVWLLAAPSKFRPQITASPPIRMNEIVNLLPTYWSPFQLKTTADLFRAQASLQFRYYLSPPHRCKSPRDGRGCPATYLRLLLRLLVTVTTLSAVERHATMTP